MDFRKFAGATVLMKNITSYKLLPSLQFTLIKYYLKFLEETFNFKLLLVRNLTLAHRTLTLRECVPNFALAFMQTLNQMGTFALCIKTARGT